jgi:hypothetical protein
MSFDWTAFKLEELDREDRQLFKPGDQYADSPEHSFSDSDIDTIREILKQGVFDEQRLAGIGFRIWGLFPTNLQASMQKFDRYADIVQSKSNSVLSLIIHTNLLGIPFELCITRRKDLSDDRMINWCRKYRVGTEIFGISNPAEVTTAVKRDKLAVILTPFEDLTDKKLLQECNEQAFSHEYDDLKATIQKIRDEDGIDIEVLERAKTIPEFHRIQDVLTCGEHNLVLYLGSCHTKEGMPVYDPGTRTPKYISIKSIETTQGSELAIFLDACKTGITATPDGSQDDTWIPKHLLEKGVSAYVGTIQDIQPTVAAVFARYFLQSLCSEGSSLCQAMYDARNRSVEHFQNEDRYKVQPASFSVYGRNTEILLNSFRHIRPQLRLIYSPMVEQYFKGFKAYIYPDSMPGVDPDRKKDVEEVVADIESTDRPFIADIPILHASRLIKNFRGNREKELVIIGGLFRLRPELDDSALFLKGDVSRHSHFCVESPLSLVTVMALTYFRFRETKAYNVFKRTTGYRRMRYDDILDYVTRYLTSSEECEPFVLASDFKKRFEDVLSEKSAESKFKKVGLYKIFKEILTEQGYDLPYDLPAEVLVTRKADYEKDPKLYNKLFQRWISWQTINKDKFPPSQDLIFQLMKKRDIEAIMVLKQFVSEELRDSFIGEIGDLSDEDFRMIDQLDESNLKKWRTECEELLHRCDEFLSIARQKCESERNAERELKLAKRSKESAARAQKANAMENRISELEKSLTETKDQIRASAKLRATQIEGARAQLERIHDQLKELAAR